MTLNGLINRRRVLLLLAAFAAAWGLAIFVTRGFVIETRWRPITSRAPIRPLALSLLVLLVYVVRYRRHWREDLGSLARIDPPRGVAVACTALALIIAVGLGTRIGGGPDESGYVSEAAMLARGELTATAPAWTKDAPWNDAAWTTAPVGYHPAWNSDRLAPTYSPGLPLLMAAFRIAAGERAVFYVVPLLAAAAVFGCYAMCTMLAGRWAGATAALLLFTSPIVLALSLQAMSDVPAMAFWTLALLAALRGNAPAAGAATGMAVLMRPNLVPLAVVVAALVVLVPGRPVRRLSIFALAAAPAVALVAALNWHYYGSPLRSGYGPLDTLYSLDGVLPNLWRYGRAFVALQTPLPLIGLLAPVVALAQGRERVRVMLVTTVLPLALFAMYLPYMKAEPHEWAFLRFLLPAYPALMAGCGIVAIDGVRRARRPALAGAVAAVAVGIVALHGWNFALRRGVFESSLGDRRYVRAVEHVQRLPRQSIFLSLAFSGTLRYYTGRDIIRFDTMWPEDIDRAMQFLRGRGYAVYLAGDAFEIELFRKRFAGTDTAARLATAPSVDLGGAFIYTL